MAGFISRAGDVFYALRFLRLLTTKWTDMNAYKVGIIDENGKQLMKSRQVPSENKKYYTIFHRLVFNIKRLLQKTPIIGRSIITNYAVGLLMLREGLGIESDDVLIEELEKILPGFKNELKQEMESSQQMNEEVEGFVQLQSGMIVTLNKDLVDNRTFEPIFKEGTKVRIDGKSKMEIFGIPIFEGTHLRTNQKMLLSIGDCVIASSFSSIDEATTATTVGGGEGASASPTSTTSSVGNLDIAVVHKRKNRPSVRKRKYKVFDVDDESFSRFLSPKKKHKRWKDYINKDDQNYNEIRKCVKRGDMVLLRDSKGRMCSVRNYKKN